MFARLGVARLSWFFFANLPSHSDGVFSRSGVTGNQDVGFAPKQSLKALEVFVSTLGSRRFLSTIREDDEAWVYVLGDEAGEPSHVVAWRPIDGDDDSTVSITLSMDQTPQSAFLLGGWE